ncbi:MAG: DUF2125 domain-containing protein [Paracoccaceae bacterium]
MLKFKLLAGLIVTVIVGAAVWWLLAARTQEAALETWLQQRRDAGWQAEAEVSILGFPNRLDVTLTDPALADPVSGWAWSAPWLEIAQVIYDPTFFVATWPAEQRLAAPGARAILRTEKMEASLKTGTRANLPLRRVSFDILNAALVADAGWTAGADRIGAHIREAPDAGPENTYEFRGDILRLRLPDFIRAQLDPAGALPPAIETATFEGRAAFDQPLDRLAFEGPKPGMTALSLSEATAEWGALRLVVSGSMKADEKGYAEGKFDIEADNWRDMLDAAVAAGAMPSAFAETLKTGLGFVARLSGDGERLDVGLVFADGLARIGPIPVGRAPRLLQP